MDRKRIIELGEFINKSMFDGSAKTNPAFDEGVILFAQQAVKMLKEYKDPVLSAMENITSNYGDQGIFEIDERRYTTNEIMEHLENNTEIGHKFRTTINEMVISYLMKFKG